MPADASTPDPAPALPDAAATVGAGADVAGTCGIVWSDDLCEYDFGPYHPMSPVRLTLTRELARASGVLDRPGVRTIEPFVASDEQLGGVHDADYIAAVRRASAPSEGHVFEDLIRFGIGGDDVPSFPGMHTASARIAGGSIAAIDAIRSGEVRHAVNIAGGLHHARPASASGFCVYNDAAVAIRHALDSGEERVMYIDTDVHHGDGVELALWDEPRAITLSVHETGERLFPGTGFVQDTGGANAQGSAINVPLPPRTTADGWVRALRATVPALVRAVRPTLLVTQHGADTHRVDPLADFSVSLEAHREVMIMLRELADEVCGGRWLALGGGGYAVIDVVPRSWAQLLAVATGEAIDPTAPLPEAYLEAEARARGEHGVSPEPSIRTYGDGRPLDVRDWEQGFDPESALDRAIQAARRGAFPEWGLDPFLD
ncbi:MULTISPECIES: acetoin utilization protein AcuC [Brachybacterium]|uniref:Acetoin utilization protein AcuC n=1 Tax=Brachybacterium alimentarium TaxID=47845 RepID=A0A2A3YM02_9MICO|nr:acetoin utilization protein AcuC [Brachybacterium alimentarium]RCS63735.1 acetoin utilization protein AcuC [Brachybacterium sp. JB7]PCC40313.1 acetoin utilization protein AcuC [Brachybacterium alimentarium]RCS68066.1 acetoin utilization protein AcuC [Brachybacterium alimentarium]RCS79497.1 acetoin utilization protein AcuC [Brachybacterium alimentarium]